MIGMRGEECLGKGPSEVVRKGREGFASFPTADDDSDGLLGGEGAVDTDDAGGEETAARVAASEGLVGSFVDDHVAGGVQTVEDPPFPAAETKERGGGQRSSDGGE